MIFFCEHLPFPNHLGTPFPWRHEARCVVSLCVQQLNIQKTYEGRHLIRAHRRHGDKSHLFCPWPRPDPTASKSTCMFRCVWVSIQTGSGKLGPSKFCKPAQPRNGLSHLGSLSHLAGAVWTQGMQQVNLSPTAWLKQANLSPTAWPTQCSEEINILKTKQLLTLHL